jgi:hypothetical protein
MSNIVTLTAKAGVVVELEAREKLCQVERHSYFLRSWVTGEARL